MFAKIFAENIKMIIAFPFAIFALGMLRTESQHPPERYIAKKVGEAWKYGSGMGVENDFFTLLENNNI